MRRFCCRGEKLSVKNLADLDCDCRLAGASWSVEQEDLVALVLWRLKPIADAIDRFDLVVRRLLLSGTLACAGGSSYI
jgi:hypothetical protein